MTNFDDLKLAVEALSGGKNTVRLDDLGMPSILVPFPKLKYADVLAGGSQDTLPAFIVDGQKKAVIYSSKFQNIIVNDRAYSLPLKDPAANISGGFDRCLTVCRNKGAGWHLLTNALWAAIALWCKQNGTQPRGNNNYGQDYQNAHEKGVPTYYNNNTTGQVGRCATGSGPLSWYHNYADSGIADLCGNVAEWVAGLRLVDGEIQIINNGNAMKHDCNMGASSTEWKAILQDGTLVNPGTANTLKWDYTTASPGAGITAMHLIAGNLVNPQADETPYGSQKFGSLVAESGVTVPQVLLGLGLFPDGVLADYDSRGSFTFRNNGERLSCRGGHWDNASNAGVFGHNLRELRSLVGTRIGFRAAFYE